MEISLPSTAASAARERIRRLPPGEFLGKRNNPRDDIPVPEQEANRHSFEDYSPEVDYLVRLSLSEKTVNMAERDLGVHSPIVGAPARMGEQNHV